MKNKSLKITLEQAVKLYSTSSNEMREIFENTFGKDFHKVNITDKVFDIPSLINHLGYDPRPFHDSKLTAFELYLNACAVIAKVAEIYNDGVILNWKNTNEYKWIPYKYGPSGGSVSVGFGGYSCGFIGSGFCYFKSKDLAEKGYNNFKQSYEDFWSIK